MDKVFPPEIKQYAASAIKAFISDVQPINKQLDCYNCGGAEIFALFCAIKGPFQSPGAPGMKQGEHYLTSHFDETAGKKGGWWVGITYTFPCPVCLKGQAQKPLMDYPTQRHMVGLMNPNTGEVEVLE